MMRHVYLYRETFRVRHLYGIREVVRSHNEDNDEEVDADCRDLKDSLAELKSVLTGLFEKVEQNEKILNELQSASSSR